ncbi:hypothetical protein JL49_15795 [Pseudoalteromonas luteoviolacea]|nr:hypothetical protein JL49_15795 [Pseudoalteromonas luteoviolacea]
MYIDAISQSLWVWDFKNDPQEAALPRSIALHRNWRVDSQGIYFISKEGTLNYFNIGKSTTKQITDKRNTFIRPIIGTQQVITYNDFWLSNLL